MMSCQRKIELGWLEYQMMNKKQNHIERKTDCLLFRLNPRPFRGFGLSLQIIPIQFQEQIKIC
jgi:hypothetical protein